MTRRPISIRFSIGRNTRHFNAGDSLGTKLLTDAIAEETISLAQARLKVRVDRIERNLERVIETEYSRAVQFAADRMIGTPSRGTTPINIVDMLGDATGGQMGRGLSGTSRFRSSMMMPRNRAAGSINWAPLSKRQVLAQQGMKSGNPSAPGKFYSHTGALRSVFKGFARAMVKRTGVVRVRVMDNRGKEKKVTATTREVEVSRVRITLMPSIYPSHLPGIRSGNLGNHDNEMRFERSLGLPPAIVEKLYGPKTYVDPQREKHRPLLQPVFTYWTLFQIPGRIATVLQRAVVTNAQSGTNEYTVGN